MKTVLVTASSAGLGSQIARAFAPDFRVVINYTNNRARGESLLHELSQIPSSLASSAPPPPTPRFHLIRADAGRRDDIQRLVRDTVAATGSLDVVVSNVGWTRAAASKDLDDNVAEADWDTCFRYNVKAHLWLMHAARPHLEASEGGGAFVCTASTAGTKPGGGSSLAYAVTKAAEIHLAKCLAVSCSPMIRVNTVSPGLLATDWGNSLPKSKHENYIKTSRLKRLPSVEDVADQVRTLVLSRSTTGQNITICAGSTV